MQEVVSDVLILTRFLYHLDERNKIFLVLPIGKDLVEEIGNPLCFLSQDLLGLGEFE